MRAGGNTGPGAHPSRKPSGEEGSASPPLQNLVFMTTARIGEQKRKDRRLAHTQKTPTVPAGIPRRNVYSARDGLHLVLIGAPHEDAGARDHLI